MAIASSSVANLVFALDLLLGASATGEEARGKEADRGGGGKPAVNLRC
jgi:hypothetical protein